MSLPKSAARCQECKDSFPLFSRRYTCRECGHNFCFAHIAARSPGLPLCVLCSFEKPNLGLNSSFRTQFPQRVLIPLAQSDFDPTEAAVVWRYLHSAGHKATFASRSGLPACADPLMVTGKGLGILYPVLMADVNGRAAHEEMVHSLEYNNPVTYDQIDSASFDAVVLPGGHAKGMRDYLESKELQRVIPEFFSKAAPVAAICHGTLLCARSVDPSTKRSVLYGRRTTGLRKDQEMTAYGLTALYLGDYYRTYPIAMETELRSFLEKPEDFVPGPLPASRDSPTAFTGFTVRDGNYLSARWPGDAHTFALAYITMLEEHGKRSGEPRKSRASS